MKIPLLFLATAAAVFAVDFSGTVTLSPGYTVAESANISVLSSVTLSGPGIYTAASWSIAGPVRLASGGEYTIRATSGAISLSILGSIRADSAATLRLISPRPITLSGTITPNITVIQGEPPPEPPPPPPAAPSSAPLLNISTRAVLAAGQSLTPGFVIGGTSPRRVLVRAIGPSLASFGVPSPLATPTLAVFSGQTQIASNAGWGGGAALSAVFSAVGAFALPGNSRDAAVVLTLNPGNYTAAIAGGAGEVLAEVYFVD